LIKNICENLRIWYFSWNFEFHGEKERDR